MKRRLKNSNEAAKYRNGKLKEQNGIDPIIGIKIIRPVLDHRHYDTQSCRGVLQNEVNAFEGKVYNSFHRYCKHLTDKPLYEVLRNLADYLEYHDSVSPDEQVIHHTALTVDVNHFKRLPANQQSEILSDFGLVPGSNIKERSKQARKLIQSGKLNMNDIKRDQK